MSIDSLIYGLSNVNAIMGLALGYSRDKSDGLSTGGALANFGMNVTSGLMRNSVAKNIQENSGSYLGYAVNSAAGYGSPEANNKATMGLLGASMLTSPYGIFGIMSPYSTLYGCGPYGNGYWNSGFFGGGCGCNSLFMFSGPTMFGLNGFWC